MSSKLFAVRCFIFILVGCTASFWSSCSGPQGEVAVPFNSYYRAFLKEKAGITVEELRDQREKTIVIHPVLVDSKNFQLQKQYSKRIQDELNRLGIFRRIVTFDTVQPKFTSDEQTKYLDFLDTFSFSHITDREFTRILTDRFGIDSILFFQVDAWPCRECLNQSLVKMNLSLVDTFSGNLLWLAFDEDYTADDLGDLSAVSDDVSGQILHAFYLAYRPLLHTDYRESLLAKAEQ